MIFPPFKAAVLVLQCEKKMLSAEAGAAFAPARPGERDRGTDMRKKLAAALAMALALAMLCGCSSAGQALNELVAAFDGAAHGADTPAFDDKIGRAHV